MRTSSLSRGESDFSDENKTPNWLISPGLRRNRFYSTCNSTGVHSSSTIIHTHRRYRTEKKSVDLGTGVLLYPHYESALAHLVSCDTILPVTLLVEEMLTR